MIIWLASYPKSGNTWLRALICSYYFSKDGIFNFDLLKQIDSFPSARFFRKYPDKFERPEDTSKYWIKEQEQIRLEKKWKQREINRRKKIDKILEEHNEETKIKKNTD